MTNVQLDYINFIYNKLKAAGCTQIKGVQMEDAPFDMSNILLTPYNCTTVRYKYLIDTTGDKWVFGIEPIHPEAPICIVDLSEITNNNKTSTNFLNLADFRKDVVMHKYFRVGDQESAGNMALNLMKGGTSFEKVPMFNSEGKHLGIKVIIVISDTLVQGNLQHMFKSCTASVYEFLCTFNTNIQLNEMFADSRARYISFENQMFALNDVEVRHGIFKRTRKAYLDTIRCSGMTKRCRELQRFISDQTGVFSSKGVCY